MKPVMADDIIIQWYSIHVFWNSSNVVLLLLDVMT